MNISKIQSEKPIKELINFSLINIDKPSGWTSYDVVSFVRNCLGIKKAGHIGTLDPNVTGVLPICLAEAVKLQQFFMKKDKTYVGKMQVHKNISKEKIEEEVKKFIGKIKQLPPVKSSVKRREREREIYDFKIFNYNKVKKEAEFRTRVEAGTYIRKLIHDLGVVIGGAHMTELRRIQAGIFEETTAITIDKFKEIVDEYKKGKEEKLREVLIPAESVTNIISVVNVKEEAVIKLKNGSPVFERYIENIKDMEKIKDMENFALIYRNELIEIAKKENKDKAFAVPLAIFK